MTLKEVQNNFLQKFNDFFSREVDEIFKHHKLAREMIHYHYNTGGKRLRPLVSIYVAKQLNESLSMDFIFPFAAAVEMIHNATLIHDDIQDGDEVRRSQPTLWKKYSIAQGINVGDLLFLAASRAIERGNYKTEMKNKLLEFLHTYSLQVVEGQVGEFELKGNLARNYPTVAEYIHVAEGKTAALFQLAAIGGALIAGANEDELNSIDYATHALGIAFQIQDDLIDLWGNKGRGEVGCDIAEGKISFPLALTFEQLNLATKDKEQLRAIILKSREQTSANDVRQAIKIFELVGAKEKSLEFFRKLESDCFSEHKEIFFELMEEIAVKVREL